MTGRRPSSPGPRTAPSTSTASASGARPRIASSIVCFIVAADDAQPWQLPEQAAAARRRRSRRAARRRRRAIGAGAAPGRAPGRTRCLQVQGMQPVEQQQARPPRRRGRRRRGSRRRRPPPPPRARGSAPARLRGVRGATCRISPGLGLGRGVGGVFHVAQQVVEPLKSALELAAVEGVGHRRLLGVGCRVEGGKCLIPARRTSGRASRRAACPDLYTCGRRRADTGRSCARPA